MLDFCEKLKLSRAAAGMSQQEVADQTLIPLRTIQKWEIGERTPPPYVQRFVLNELAMLERELNKEIKTETYTQYAAFAKLQNGQLRKLHAFYCPSAKVAERAVQEHKNIYPQVQEYKVMRREVTTTKLISEWEEVNE